MKSRIIIVWIVVMMFYGCSTNSIEEKRETLKIGPKLLRVDHPLVGKWKVVESSFVPFEHISYCDNLTLGSIFEFKRDRTLSVSPSENAQECTKNQSFTLNVNAIEIIEYDMIFEYPVVAFTGDSLTFKIERIPSNIWDSLKPKTERQANEILEKGIIVTLEKIENGG